MSITEFENLYSKLVKDFNLATSSPDEVVKIIGNLSTDKIEYYVVTTLDDFIEHVEEYVDLLRKSFFEFERPPLKFKMPKYVFPTEEEMATALQQFNKSFPWQDVS